jgi:hypothetical protein
MGRGGPHTLQLYRWSLYRQTIGSDKSHLKIKYGTYIHNDHDDLELPQVDALGRETKLLGNPGTFHMQIRSGVGGAKRVESHVIHCEGALV